VRPMAGVAVNALSAWDLLDVRVKANLDRIVFRVPVATWTSRGVLTPMLRAEDRPAHPGIVVGGQVSSASFFERIAHTLPT
jgi:hypothetical protein